MKLLLLTLCLALACCCAVAAASAVADVPIRLALKQDPSAIQALEDTLYAVSSPQSKRYGHHLSALQIGHIIGRSASEIKTITRWLKTDSAVGALKGSVRVHETRDYIDVIVPASVASEMVGDHLQRQRDGSRASVGIGRFSSHPAASLVDFAIHLDQKHNQAIRLSAESESEYANWQRLPSRAERRARYAIDHLNKQKAEAAKLKKSGSAKKLHSRVKAPNDNSGTPANQRSAYGVPASLTCTNPKNRQMIWGTGTYGFTASDLQSYYSQMNIPASELQLLTVTDYPGVEGGDNWGEGTLDISLISSIAPGVLTFVSNTDNSQSAEEGDGFGPAMLSWMTGLIQNASTQGLPNVISLSLGSLSWDSCNLLCEGVAAESAGATSYAQCQSYMQQQRQVCMYPDSAGLDRMNVEFAKLGTMGVTVMAATGDGGSHFSFQFFGSDPIGTLLNQVACKMNSPTFPAESPYVVGVGGTDWSTGVTTPVAWAASGGGFSWRYPVPQYQSAAVSAYLSSTTPPPNSAFNRSNRAYPDVAALAINVPIVFSGSLSAAAGTSCSAPEFSALMSLLNDVRLNAGLAPLGFVLPAFYALASNPSIYPTVFYDMSSGSSDCDSNGECCNEGTGFQAASGWDPTTGLGSPLFAGLQAQLGNNDFLKLFQ